ncbi:hypothetical protein [Nocardia sp. CDC160]|uniref:hypothetical protein n=1 Tax=Nocardia sp. CDC160 TaxID=3112166 RepID=UPI002DBBF108|nr:hypothetical protein [Nocardia sp. CDC160]MEC3919284.1 hypothetical protein [Nocardia sp. CDC160]
MERNQKAFYRGFPDGRHVIDDVLIAGNRFVTRCRFVGTHTSTFARSQQQAQRSRSEPSASTASSTGDSSNTTANSTCTDSSSRSAQPANHRPPTPNLSDRIAPEIRNDQRSTVTAEEPHRIRTSAITVEVVSSQPTWRRVSV